MICVIQRVKSAQVLVEKKVCSKIGAGLLALVGIESSDKLCNIDKMINNATQNIIDDVTKNVITDTPNNVIVKYAEKVIDDKIENDITDTPKNVIDDVTENVITDTPKNVIDDVTENFVSDTPNNFIKHESIRIRVPKRKKVRKLKKKQPSKI